MQIDGTIPHTSFIGIKQLAKSLCCPYPPHIFLEVKFLDRYNPSPTYVDNRLCKVTQGLNKLSCHLSRQLLSKLQKADFNIYLFILFIYFWAALGLRCCMLAAVSGGYSSLRCVGLLQWPLSLQSMGFRHAGFSSCGTWAHQLWLMGCRGQAQQLWFMGLVALRHVGSSWTRARTRDPALAGRFLTTAPPEKPPIKLILKMIYQNNNYLIVEDSWTTYKHQ